MITYNNTYDIDSISLEFNNKFNKTRFINSYKTESKQKVSKVLNMFDSLYPGF